RFEQVGRDTSLLELCLRAGDTILGHAPHLPGFEPEADNLMAVPGQGKRDSSTDAVGSSGHDRDLPLVRHEADYLRRRLDVTGALPPIPINDWHGDGLVGRWVAEDIHWILARPEDVQLFQEHLTEEDDALIGGAQALLSAVNNVALGLI